MADQWTGQTWLLSGSMELSGELEPTSLLQRHQKGDKRLLFGLPTLSELSFKTRRLHYKEFYIDWRPCVRMKVKK